MVNKEYVELSIDVEAPLTVFTRLIKCNITKNQ